MTENFQTLKITKQQREIDLFAKYDVDALIEAVLKAFKRNSTRLTTQRDAFLTDLLPDSTTDTELYFPFNEEEVESTKLQPAYHNTQFDMRQDVRLAKSVLKRNIIRYFRKKSCIIDIDHIGRIRVWVIANQNEKQREYQRFLINLRHNDQCEGWQMEIAEGNRAIVANTSIANLPDLPNVGFDVVANLSVICINKVAQHHWNATDGNLYPVVNPRIARLVGCKTFFNRDTNKLAHKRAAAQSFVDQWICTDDFCREVGISFPNGHQFATVPSHKVKQVDDAAKELIYGDRTSGKAPRSEFHKHGPYRSPEKPYTFFFISPNDARSLSYCKRMYNIFTQGYDCAEIIPNEQTPDERKAKKVFTPMAKLLRQQLLWEKKLSCYYPSPAEALSVLKDHLHSSRFQKNVQYMAIILTDISRDDPDSTRHEMYYLMKELLMQYNIASQVIYRNNIDSSSFRFFLSNIATALVGKMGGMPWGVNTFTSSNDMIVGIGASKQAGMAHPYLGSAFCFDKEGHFQDFNTCRADDTEALMSKLKRSIWRFCQEHGKPDRLIIHYYKKKLNKEESRQIERMLRDYRIDCPVYIVNVVTAVNEDLIAFDETQADCMPLSGTYVHLRRNDYLLYNNERYYANQKADILYPIKLSITTGRNTNEATRLDDSLIKELITQVYQFCRLYWRSVKMQNAPITIAYPEMVAKCVPHFKTEELPEYGHRHLWML